MDARQPATQPQLARPRAGPDRSAADNPEISASTGAGKPWCVSSALAPRCFIRINDRLDRRFVP